MTRKSNSSTSKAQHSVLLIDDHPMTRYGMARLIEQEPDLLVCGEAPDAQSALAAVKAHKPDVALVDLTMPGGEGLELIKDIRTLHPDVAVLVVSMHDEELYAERALRAGARGYIMKNEGGEKLVEAIRQVLLRKTWLSENMSERVTEIFSGRRRRGDNTALGKLTDREFEVFRLLGQGLTGGEIGERLRLSTKTVETHRLHLREKLGLKTGPALIKYAVRWAGAQELI
jgi:DNA-binding NarL/FixJ family response regulator